MKKRTIILSVTAAAVAATLAGGAAVAVSTAGVPTAGVSITGVSSTGMPTASPSTAGAEPTGTEPTGTAGIPDELEAAIDVALAEAGPGVVVRAYVAEADEQEAYGVGIRLDAGGYATVRLREDLTVIAVQSGVWSDDDRDDADDRDDRDDADDSDDRIVSAAERASAAEAALAHVGSGTVVEVERSDDADHAYEVEIEFADGRDADVELAADFTVTRAK